MENARIEVDVTTAKRKAIGRLADQVREALKLTVPVDFEGLCAAVDRMGGQVRLMSGFSVREEASIQRTDDGHSFVITLDGFKPDRRMLFSLAHEIGHLFVHMGFGNKERWNQQRDYIESYARRGYDEEEFEANEFAAALLMPSDEFKRLASCLDIKSIADRFGVSVDAAKVRGRWLGVYEWR